ncbi:uncharacterized protein [Euphorbia lathyris]|uniref:uncharacterized protein n=1 Tax=Euphorbia lathyris TaxID=212925 RepID=UPI003313E866
MALFVATGNSTSTGGRIIYSNLTRHHPYTLPHRPQIVFPVSTRRSIHFKVSAKKLSPAGKFDGSKRRSSTKTKDKEDEGNYDGKRTNEIERSFGTEGFSASKSVGVESSVVANLPGAETDFWEGPQWDAFGFVMQYLWAFGVGFALIACGVAVSTYNEGATDFKDTPAYKASVESQELIEEPEASNSDVFESNPTEVAPSLE